MKPRHIYFLQLPLDCQIPLIPNLLSLAPKTIFRPYLPVFIQAETIAEEQAWFYWCTGHHLIFLYWEVMYLVCNKITQIIENEQDILTLSLWLNRLGLLIKGNAAAMTYTGSFVPSVYDSFLRPTMKQVRDDFSGQSSLDYTKYFVARCHILNLLKNLKTDQKSTDLDKAIKFFFNAEKVWTSSHLDVISSLHPGLSLLQQKIFDLNNTGVSICLKDYLKQVIKSPTALAQFDAYFGVIRREDLSFIEYLIQVIHRIALVQEFQNLPPDKQHSLLEGNALILKILIMEPKRL